MSNRTGIDLLVPGLLGPMSALQDLDLSPQVQTLEASLSRADVAPIDADDYAATLFHLLGVTTNDSGDLPTAPYCRLADGGEKDGGFWLQVSPVHLRPDGKGLLLFDAGVLEITLDESRQLVDLIREHFRDHPWKLDVYAPGRWYLGLTETPDMQTAPLSDVIGRNIDRFLPRGGDAMDWHSIMNEIQMLLHTSKVNMLREGRGQLPINGVWLHGGGVYQPIEGSIYRSVIGDDPLLRGLASAAGIEPCPLPQDGDEAELDTGSVLTVYDRLQRSVLNADPYGWVDSVECFNAWLQPLLGKIRSKQIGYIDIHPCNGHIYRISARSLRRFWRSGKALTHLVSG